MKKFLKWIWYSSDNPESVSKTIKGIGLLFIPEIVKLANEIGIHTTDIVFITIITKIATIFGIVLTIVGIVRKLYNTYSDKEVVTFNKNKKK